MYLALPLTLQIEQCVSPSVCYLRWLSPIGTWEGWAFGNNGATTDLKTDITEATDVRSADGRAQVAVRRAAGESWVVRIGDLTPAQHQALSTILDSPQVYEQLPDGRRRPVLVASTSASRTSVDSRTELELEVKLPPRNALTH